MNNKPLPLINATGLEAGHAAPRQPRGFQRFLASRLGLKAAAPPQELGEGRGAAWESGASAAHRSRSSLPAGQYIPILRRFPVLLDLIELAVLLGIIFMITQPEQLGAMDNTRMPGVEMHYLINSGAVAAEVFQRYHAIPLWNSLVGHGEPLFESLFSFVLNPFMTVPLLALGPNDGVKLAIVIHMFMIGLGGWVLGRSLRMHAGAMLLGVMMAASGSMIAPLSNGFYQIGLSLAYTPWIYAGLIGFLYREHYRRWLGIFVVALTMMTFAGTFWFVVPAIIACGALALFGLIKPKDPTVVKVRLRRLIVAGAFFAGFAALSLLPRLNSWLVYHPAQGLGQDTYDLFQIFNSFFVPDKLVTADWWFAYQYMIPGAFAIAVVVGRLALGWLKSPFTRWRILLPSALLILFFCVWAQDNTPLFHLIYDHSFLIQWRWPVRVAAAASPFLAVILALWFDEIVTMLLRLRIEFWLVALAVLGFGLYTAEKSSNEWPNQLHFMPYEETTPEHVAMEMLRREHPGEPLSLLTEGMVPDFVLYHLDIRTPIGNPDVYTNGPPSDYPNAMNWLPLYAFAKSDGYRDYVKARGYLVYPNSPVDESGGPTLWYFPQALPYAFVIPPGAFDHLNSDGQLTDDRVNPVTSVVNQYDRVLLTVDSSQADSIMVVQETDYPGWVASVDGKAARLKSFNGLLALDLSAGKHTIVLEYHSPLLVLGLIVYVVTLLLFIGYLLHIDQRISGTRFDPRPRLHGVLTAYLIPRDIDPTDDSFGAEE